jgi:glutathione-independent formaldehyde dehydrogenase
MVVADPTSPLHRRSDTAQCNTKHYNAALRDLIIEGKATELPGLSRAEAGRGLPGRRHFDKRYDGWTKVVLHP